MNYIYDFQTSTNVNLELFDNKLNKLEQETTNDFDVIQSLNPNQVVDDLRISNKHHLIKIVSEIENRNIINESSVFELERKFKINEDDVNSFCDHAGNQTNVPISNIQVIKNGCNKFNIDFNIRLQNINKVIRSINYNINEIKQIYGINTQSSQTIKHIINDELDNHRNDLHNSIINSIPSKDEIIEINDHQINEAVKKLENKITKLTDKFNSEINKCNSNINKLNKEIKSIHSNFTNNDDFLEVVSNLTSAIQSIKIEISSNMNKFANDIQSNLIVRY